MHDIEYPPPPSPGFRVTAVCVTRVRTPVFFFMVRHGIHSPWVDVARCRRCHGAPWHCHGNCCRDSPGRRHGTPLHVMVLHGTPWPPTNCHRGFMAMAWGCHGYPYHIIFYFFVSSLSLSSSTCIGGFTLSSLLLDKPWSQVSSLIPPGTCLLFFAAHRVQHSHCSSVFIECS